MLGSPHFLTLLVDQLMLLKERAQAGGSLEMRDRVNLLERRGEGVGERPERPGREVRVRRVEVQVVDAPVEMARHFELAFDERLVDEELGARNEADSEGQL